MNHQVFLAVVEQYNQGEVEFNLGTNWSFLFNNKWYPTMSFMKQYYRQLGQDQEYNLYKSAFELSKYIPLISAEINYINNYPVEI
jgi:hypothetical protein